MFRATFRLFAALFLIAGIFLAQATPASAHTEKQEASPVPNSTVKSPTQVELTFGDRIQKGLSKITVTNKTTGKTASTGAVTHPTNNAMAIALSNVENGVYSVDWSMVAADGHRQTGSYEFTAEVPSTPVTSSTATETAPWENTMSNGSSQAVETQSAVQSDDSSNRNLILAGGGLVAVVSLVVAFLAFRPRY